MNRPHEIKRRIANIDQIEAVVGAMRALAAAHETEAARHLDAIREQAATVAAAMASVLPLLAGTPPTYPAGKGTPGRHLRIVVGAAQGFSGSYNERIVAAAGRSQSATPPDDFIVIGGRCIAELEDRGVVPVWSAHMAAHAAEVPQLANRVVDAVFDLIAEAAITRVSILSGVPSAGGDDIVEGQLVPMDFSRIKPDLLRAAPLITLAPDILIARLVEEYVYTQICEALMLGFAAENDARLKAMSRAKTNVARIAENLKSAFNQAMQEQTTTEIIELSQSVT